MAPGIDWLVTFVVPGAKVRPSWAAYAVSTAPGLSLVLNAVPKFSLNDRVLAVALVWLAHWFREPMLSALPTREVLTNPTLRNGCVIVSAPAGLVETEA